MDQKKIPKSKWHNVDSGTIARNTATGVMVESRDTDGEDPSSLFIEGEFWNYETERFEVLESRMTNTDRIIEALEKIVHVIYEGTPET